MQVVTLDSLLKSAIPCSSSSTFLPELSSSIKIVNFREENHPFASAAKIKVVGEGPRGKRRVWRKGIARCDMLKVLPQCLVIVGRLQLCNRNVHYRNGLFLPADCVALTDSTASICCCICRGPDPSYLGQIVRVNSWSYIPRKGTPLTSLQSPRSENSDSRSGILEIHSLELVKGCLEEKPVLTSLFVSPAAADVDNDPQEIDLEPLERQGRGLLLRGTLDCISPPFILPCKSSRDNGNCPSQAGEGRVDLSPGFFVEILFCSACSPTCFYVSTNFVKREFRRPRKLDEVETLTASLGESPGFRSKSEYRTMTTQRSPVDKSSSCLSKPCETAEILWSKRLLEAGGVLSHLYFSGPIAAWRPVLSCALGRCVAITGLQEKVILVGSDKKPHIILLATDDSLVTLDCGKELLSWRPNAFPVHSPEVKSLNETFGFKDAKIGLDRLNTKRRNFRVEARDSPAKKPKRLLEFGSNFNELDGFERDRNSSRGCGHGDGLCMEVATGRSVYQNNKLISFVGIVTDILFQGTLLELDERVWLLLTHQRHTKLHALRNGSMLSLRNVHSIPIRDLMGKSLLFGACMHSHVSVVLFSPYTTPASLQIQSKSLLLKHIQRLSFTSTFWVLSLIGSFRQKFRYTHSNKELLGTKKVPGIIQKYAQRMISPEETPERDVVKEYFQKKCCKFKDLHPSTPIMQVPPIANFCEHIQALWQNYTSHDIWSETRNLVKCRTSGSGDCNAIKQLGKSWQLRQLTIASQELGMTLLGSLQVCQTSGNLYLSDATGIIDVVVSDLSSSEHLSRTYQVSRFTVKLEGLHQASPTANDGIVATLISWSCLLKEVKAVPKSKFVKCSVHFLIRDATYLHEFNRGENVTPPLGPLSHSKGKEWWQKRVQDRWVKTKSHLDFLRLWFQSKSADQSGAHYSTHWRGPLSEPVGELASCDFFKVNCKVVAVKLLVFEWPCGPASNEVIPWLGANCSSTSRQSPFGIPLTQACFVVDDGSGPVDCWALGDTAVSLLGLANVTGPLNLPDELLERICSSLALVSHKRRITDLSLEQILCRMTQRYGQIVLQTIDTAGDYLMNSESGNSFTVDQRSLMHLVVTNASLNRSLAIVANNIPSMQKICSADKKKGTGPCELLACCSPRSQYYTSLGHPRATLLARRVHPVNYLSDCKTLAEQVAELLQDK